MFSRAEFASDKKVYIPSDIDWNAVHNECEKYGVLAVTWRTLGKLQKEGLIATDNEKIQMLVMKWLEWFI